MRHVVYTGPDESVTLHITAEPLTFVRGEAVAVFPAVRDALMALASNQSEVYGWWVDHTPEPEPTPATPSDEALPPVASITQRSKRTARA